MVGQKIQNLRYRARFLKEIRQFFEQNGYWEVETPLLSHDTCVDRHINPIELKLSEDRLFLQTSPEFAMKRLLIEGADEIFQISKAFREGEVGENHNPEFTMVEWYSTSRVLNDQISFVEELILYLIRLSNRQGWIKTDDDLAVSRYSYEEAFSKHAGLSIFACSQQQLVTYAQKFGWSLDELDSDRDDLLNYLWANTVEPAFQGMGIVSIYDYPASQAALAKIRDDKHQVAERFETYVNGLEMCNGYQELTDGEELLRRMRNENLKRGKQMQPELPAESQLARDMVSLNYPESSGVALGFDRLVMLCLGAKSLRDVIAFPYNKA